MPVNTGTTDWLNNQLRMGNDHFQVIVATILRSLRLAGLPAYEAALVSLIRAQCIKFGLYVGSLNARSVPVNEIGNESDATLDDTFADLRGQ